MQLQPTSNTTSFPNRFMANSELANDVFASSNSARKECTEFEALLFGYLALNNFLNEDQRWVTIVSSQAVNRSICKSLFGLHSRLRIICCAEEDILWISWQCLAQGNSQAVISILAGVVEEERKHLVDAGIMGQSACHIVQPGSLAD